ncbi:MAG: FAD-dependent oxidoreductase, partial [Gammaproteobacteria bacterium]
MANDYDLLVLGGGSGGLAVARRAAAHGARCAVIESGKLGGTCVNRGCVPKKIMWYAADIAHTLPLAADYGFDASPGELDWARLKVARDSYIKRLNQIYRTSLEDSRVELIQGYGRFADAHTVEVEGKRYQAPHIVIATGGRPIVPALPGARFGITSDGFFGLFTQPRRVAIVGSGYIATELAGMLCSLGSEVTMLIRSEWFLNGFDVMIREALMEAMQHQGINVLCSIMVERVSRDQEGLLSLHTTSDQQLTGFDCLIWAVGRAPNSERLNLEAAGVRCDGRGMIPTDEFQNTNVPGIYALGDITGRAALTPVAIAAGRHLADRLFGGQTDSRLDYRLIPTVIFSHPP